MASKIEKLEAIDRKTGVKNTVYPETVASAVKLNNGEDLNSAMSRALYGSNVVFITKAEYEALTEEEQNEYSPSIMEGLYKHPLGCSQ